MTNLSCSYGLQLFLRLCAMSADLKGAVLRKLGDEPRWAGLRFRRELPLWLTEISAVPAYNPWSNRRQAIPPELIGKIAPTRLESINLRGVFRFPVDRYADQILPSRQGAPITGTNG